MTEKSEQIETQATYRTTTTRKLRCQNKHQNPKQPQRWDSDKLKIDKDKGQIITTIEVATYASCDFR